MKEKAKALIVAFDIKKFIKFGTIGVLNTLVDAAVFFVVYRLLCTWAGLDISAAGNPTWVTAAAQADGLIGV